MQFRISNRIVVILMTILPAYLQAQNFNATSGLSAQIGSHNRKVAIWLRPQVVLNTTQVYNMCELALYQKGLGSKKTYLQGLAQLGITQSFGKIFAINNDLPIRWTTWSMDRTWQIGYHFNWYLDTRNTSQRTGTITIQYRKWQLSTENDALAFSPKDRYRTGGIRLMFLDSNFAISQEVLLWTRAQKNATNFHNHGIVATSFHYKFGTLLPLSTSLGYDSEKIRNFFQNKLVHQSRWLAKLNPTVQQKIIPMESQKPKVVWQTSYNDLLRY
jgi:Bacterial toxin 23